MKQSRIPVNTSKPPDPANEVCNWCDDQAVNRHEIKRGTKRIGTQMYIFTCRTHKQKGMDAVAAPPRTTRK